MAAAGRREGEDRVSGKNGKPVEKGSQSQGQRHTTQTAILRGIFLCWKSESRDLGVGGAVHEEAKNRSREPRPRRRRRRR